jgi:Concanavalin A-like lectin/glucanases superfamily
MSAPGVPLTAINGGMTRLRVKGAARKDSLYLLKNAYVTVGNTVKVKPGTFRHTNLADTTGVGETKGLVAYHDSFHVFSDHEVSVPAGYTLHVLNHPAATEAAPQPPPLTSGASMLLHFEDGNGSTTFTDSAGLLPAPVWTATGAGVQETTARSKFGTGSLVIPSNATGFYISTPAASLGNIDFRFGGDFTIECFAYLSAWGPSNRLIWAVEDATNVTRSQLYVDSTGATVFNIPSQATLTSAAAVFVKNQWNHVAITRYGSFLTVWVNGVAVVTGSRGTSIMTAWTAGTLFKIGGCTSVASGGSGFGGNIDEFRMVIGQALYTATFTPPSAPLAAAIPNVSGSAVSVLHFDDGSGSVAFVDSGTNPSVWSAHNTAGTATESIAQAKFGSGSLLLSSTDAAIITPQNTGGNLDITTGDFTVEFWCYPTAQTKTYLDTHDFAYLLDFSANNTTLFHISVQKPASQYGVHFQAFGANGWAAAGSGNLDSLNVNAWNHITIMRRNDMLSFGINGNLYYISNTGSAPTGDPPALPSSGNNAYLGARFDIPGYGGAGWTGGHIDEVIVTKGVAKYGGPGSVYTPPVAPQPPAPILTQPIPLKEIHFAAPFMGFLYVVAEFNVSNPDTLKLFGDTFHYWLQTSGEWMAKTVYKIGQIISPTVPNGFFYRATRMSAPNPVWTPNTLKTVGDIVEPTVPNGYYFTATSTDGDNPITGPVEPTWPTSTGATVAEDSEATGGDVVAGPAPQPGTGTPSAGTGTKYTNPYSNLITVAGK